MPDGLDPRSGGDDAAWWGCRFMAQLVTPGPLRAAPGSAKSGRRRVVFSDAVAVVEPVDPATGEAPPAPSSAPDRRLLRSRGYWLSRKAATTPLKDASRSPGNIAPASVWMAGGEADADGGGAGALIAQNSGVVLKKADGPTGMVLERDLTLTKVEEGSRAAAAGCEKYVGWRLSVANGAGLTTLEDYEWYVQECPDEVELRFEERGVALDVIGVENECAGRYEQILGQKVNQNTVWRKVGADRYLYSTPAGKWIFSDKESMSHGGGWALTSKLHNGKQPHEMLKWKQSWMAKSADPDIKIVVSDDQSAAQEREEGSRPEKADAKPEAATAAAGAYGGFGEVLRDGGGGADAAAPVLSGIAAAEQKAKLPPEVRAALEQSQAATPNTAHVQDDEPLVQETRPDPSDPTSIARYTRNEFMKFYGDQAGVIMWARAGEEVEPEQKDEDPDAERRVDPRDPAGGKFTRREFISFYGTFHGPIQWDKVDPAKQNASDDEGEEEEEEEEEADEEETPLQVGTRVMLLRDQGTKGFGRTAQKFETGVISALSGARFVVRMDSGVEFNLDASVLQAMSAPKLGSLANPKGSVPAPPEPKPKPAAAPPAPSRQPDISAVVELQLRFLYEANKPSALSLLPSFIRRMGLTELLQKATEQFGQAAADHARQKALDKLAPSPPPEQSRPPPTTVPSPPRPDVQPPRTLPHEPRRDQHDCFPTGTIIEVVGLEKDTHLNGCTGPVIEVKLLKDGRYCMLVRLQPAPTPSHPSGETSRQLLLPKNVRLPRVPLPPPPPSPPPPQTVTPEWAKADAAARLLELERQRLLLGGGRFHPLQLLQQQQAVQQQQQQQQLLLSRMQQQQPPAPSDRFVVTFLSAKGNTMRFWRDPTNPGQLRVSENGVEYPAFRRLKAGKDASTGDFFVDFDEKVYDGGRPGVVLPKAEAATIARHLRSLADAAEVPHNFVRTEHADSYSRGKVVEIHSMPRVFGNFNGRRGEVLRTAGGRVQVKLAEGHVVAFKTENVWAHDPESTHGAPTQLRVKRPQGATLGVGVTGMLITRVAPDGPGAQAGVEVGMLLDSVDGRKVTNTETAKKALSEAPSEFIITVRRRVLPASPPAPAQQPPSPPPPDHRPPPAPPSVQPGELGAAAPPYES